jgi:peptidoglycan/xylan/chitin deacetylase (PgdA/CDA1 family)
MLNVNTSRCEFAYTELRGLRIIYYHRFDYDQAKQMLDAQCQYLRSRYDVISMDRAPSVLAEHTSRPANSLIVAVDDGHRDFYEIAMPIFKKHNIPAICYLVTDFIEGVDWLWFDKVDLLCARSPRAEVNITLPNGKELLLPMAHSKDRRTAAMKLKEALKTLPYENFLATLDKLPSLMQAALPGRPPSQYAPLSWDEIREMTDLGMSFGAHTCTHPILSRIADVRKLSDEILGSKKYIERELQTAVLHFAYPNGRLLDIAPECPTLLRDGGFKTAVTTVHGINDGTADVLRLKRIWVEPFLEMSYFQQRVSSDDFHVLRSAEEGKK